MGKRKVEEIGVSDPNNEIDELPDLVIDSREFAEGEVGSEGYPSQLLVGASLSPREHSRSEEPELNDQLERPTVSTGEEEVTATSGVTTATEGGSEAELEPYTFWQILELAGYELW